MAEDLFTQDTLSRVLGAARLLKLIRAGWLTPVKRTPNRVLYRAYDIHLVLRRLERGESPPSDKVEVLRIRASETRNGRGRIRKVKLPRPTVDDIELDFSGINLNGVNL